MCKVLQTQPLTQEFCSISFSQTDRGCIFQPPVYPEKYRQTSVHTKKAEENHTYVGYDFDFLVLRFIKYTSVLEGFS